ncbi:MAG: hypothetical protein ACLGGX_12505 [Bdellovibrionia bacterium]
MLNKIIQLSVIGIFSLLFVTTTQAQPFFELNDVSILFPIPEKLDQEGLLKAQDFLPLPLVKKFPRFLMQYKQDDTFEAMRAVSLRLDPHTYHLRTVWQPLMKGPQGKVRAMDVAFHSFHQLSELEFKQLIVGLRLWKNQHAPNIQGLPLQIHPAMINAFSENVAAPRDHQALSALLQTVIPYMQNQKLIKLTAMVLRGADDMWAFMGVKVIDASKGLVEPLIVARTPQMQAQSFINSAVPFDSYEMAQVSGVASTEPFNLLNLISKVSGQRPLTESEIRDSLKTTYQLENPKLFKEDDMDCVHCHISQGAQAYLKNNFAQEIKDQIFTNEYQNKKYNLQNMSRDKFNTRQIRGFGYFEDGPAISQRVIHDSAEAADYINQFFK